MTPDVPTPNTQNKPASPSNIDLSDPYTKVLLGTDFVTEESLQATGLSKIPEFLVMKLFEEFDSLDQETIEEKVDHPLVAAAVKNLQDSEIIVDNGGKYELSGSVASELS